MTPSSRSSKSAGLRLSTVRPRASVAKTSMWTRSARAGGGWSVEAAPTTAIASTATRPRAIVQTSMRRHARQPVTRKPISSFASPSDGLDFEDVLAGRHAGQRQVELLLALFRRRLRRQLGHRRAGAIEDVHAQRRRRAARAVHRHANQQAIGAAELARRPSASDRASVFSCWNSRTVRARNTSGVPSSRLRRRSDPGP